MAPAPIPNITSSICANTKHPNPAAIFILLMVFLLMKTTRFPMPEKIFFSIRNTCLRSESLHNDFSLILRTRLSQPVRNQHPVQMPIIPKSMTSQIIRISSESIACISIESPISQITTIIPAAISVYHRSKKFKCTFSSSLFRPAATVRITIPTSARINAATETTIIGTSHGSNFS